MGAVAHVPLPLMSAVSPRWVGGLRFLDRKKMPCTVDTATTIVMGSDFMQITRLIVERPISKFYRS